MGWRSRDPRACTAPTRASLKSRKHGKRETGKMCTEVLPWGGITEASTSLHVSKTARYFYHQKRYRSSKNMEIAGSFPWPHSRAGPGKQGAHVAPPPQQPTHQAPAHFSPSCPPSPGAAWASLLTMPWAVSLWGGGIFKFSTDSAPYAPRPVQWAARR